MNIQRSWLVVERLPAYAPELNPVEGLWANLKAVESANLTGPTLTEVIDQAHKGIDRVRRTPHLAYFIPTTHRPVGLMTHQPDTQEPPIYKREGVRGGRVLPRIEQPHACPGQAV